MMKARYHFVVAVFFIIVLGIINNPIQIIPFMLGAYLVDCDHQFDFWLRTRRITFSVTELSETLSGHVHFILPLHSYEAIIASILLIPVFPPYMSAFAVGLAVHMVFDWLTNGYPGFLSFSLVYRIVNWRNEIC